MVEGLEVVIRYRGTKYDKVACPKSASSEFATLKKDLARLRVHSPSYRNVQRVGGSFILHWPNAAVSKKLLTDSLYTRWFKLCSADDPEAVKLREMLSIESITMKQDGVVMYSTPRTPKDYIPLGSKSSHDLVEIGLASAPTPRHASPMEPPPPEASIVKHPPASVPSVPSSYLLALSHSIEEQLKADGQQIPPLKRRNSPPNDPSKRTRQKLDIPEVRVPPLINTQPQPTLPIITTRPASQEHATSSFAEPESMDIPPPRESSEVVPRETPHSAPGGSADLGTSLLPFPRSVSQRDTESSFSSGSGSHPHSLSIYPQQPQDESRQREQDVSRLTRQLQDTRRELATMRAREKIIMNNLGQLGVRVPREEVRAESADAGAGSEGDQNGKGVSREGLEALEAELREERARRVRAERALGDVEWECRTPFVVPALFQAFMSISELSS